MTMEIMGTKQRKKTWWKI